MRLPSLLIFFSIFAFCLSVTEAEAQNPRQSKKRAKKMRKMAKKKREAYTPTHNENDTDGDGVPDNRDQCYDTPKGQKVTPFGCPMDTDFDGIYDFEDQCVNEKGPEENYGCPWGDQDNDGIYDNDDECPATAGIPAYKGCPDTDKDHIVDYKDACPEEAGPEENKGCPYKDTDGDGVKDFEDLCPLVEGVKHNKGCPEEKPEVKEALKNAFDNLLFETGKAVIKQSSFQSLDELAVVMKKYPAASLYIEGHTDDVGDDYDNQVLSEDRAEAVKKYLVTQGVPEGNIEAKGFGETRPVADNSTSVGRQKNRRVEMNVVYKE